MDIKLYKKLLNFRSYSKSKEQIVFRKWLRNYVEKNIPNTTTKVDSYGNLYVTKGTDAEVVNCVVAHLDINQKVRHNVKVVQVNDIIFGFDTMTGRQCGVGHDDKAGVYFALQALQKYDNLKVFFPLDEEVGCIGTSKADLSFFHNVGFMVQLDRNGYGDISEYTNSIDVVTEETKSELAHILDEYNYDWEYCVYTDVGELVDALGIQGVNISCGYKNEHSDEEILRISWYENAELFAFALLEQTEGKVYKIDVSLQYNNYYNKSYGARDYGGYDDYELPDVSAVETLDSEFLDKSDEELREQYEKELKRLVTLTQTPIKDIIIKIDFYMEKIYTAEYYYDIDFTQTRAMLSDYMDRLYEWLSFEEQRDEDLIE